MSQVFIRKADLTLGAIREHLFGMLARIDTGRIGKGSRVLIKPNLLAAASPDQAVTTHPLIVRAAVEYLLERGAQVRIGDSPAIGSFDRILKQCGYRDALAGLDVRVAPFTRTVGVDIGEPFGVIQVARAAMEADAVFNLAKLKTHCQMLLTLGVKNLFGCIVGMQKPEWHFRVGVDRAHFARLLVQICEAVGPMFTLVDGILALEGQGPGRGGTPRQLDLLVGGDSAHAVDKVLCLLLGVEPCRLPTCAAADALGLLDGEVSIHGDMVIRNDLTFPRMIPLTMGPKCLARFMRRFAIQKPVTDNRLCKLCGECWKYCPAKVISHHIKGVRFDYGGCIRCYCCIEVCPHGALSAREPLLGKIWRWFDRRNTPC
jgi:uncharacterized protein (DUF362 family)/Pyruvate/2-oxoacid:ferredoxin oxidoreductase delta subunit